MAKISAVIITFNEERNIERCLQTLRGVADEIIVVDSGSTDRTELICKDYNARFIHQPFLGYTEQKNFATSKASFDFVLSLDADEALSDELHQSILKVKESQESSAYTFNRLTNYCGHWVKYSGWYPDKKLRLYDRRKGSWTGGLIHESYELNEAGTVSHLKGDLLHYSYHSISDHIQRANKYSLLAAEEMFKKGKKISVPLIIIKTFARFFKAYILRRGYMDGIYGLLISSIGAQEVLLKYSRLYLLNKGNASTKDSAS